MLSWLSAVLDILSGKTYREHQAELAREVANERALERDHQLVMIQTIADKLIELQGESQKGILALASAQAANASVLSDWLKGFAIPPGAPTKFESDETPYIPATPGGLDDFIPPELRLAFALQTGNDDAFDREVG